MLIFISEFIKKQKILWQELTHLQLLNRVQFVMNT